MEVGKQKRISEIIKRLRIVNISEKDFQTLWSDILANDTVRYNTPDLPFKQFFIRNKPIDIDLVTKNSLPYYKYWEEASAVFKDSPYAPVEIGDIMHFSAREWGYPFGHLAITLGQRMYYYNDGIKWVAVPLVFKAENSGMRGMMTLTNFMEQIYKHTHLTSPSSNSFKNVTYDFILPRAFTSGRGNETSNTYYPNAYISPINYNSASDQNPLSIIRYKGPLFEQIRALVAILAYGLILSNSVKYEGICYLLSTSCFNNQKIIKRILEYLEALKMGQLGSVCSGFAGIVYQIAFYLAGFNENQISHIMPMDVLACRPTHFLELPIKYPEFWESRIITGWSNYDISLRYNPNVYTLDYSLIPLMKSIDSFRYYVGDNGKLGYNYGYDVDYTYL
jgi:hypothetical protein